MYHDDFRKLLMAILHLDEASWDRRLRLYDDLGLDSLAKVRIADELARATGSDEVAAAALKAHTVGGLHDLLLEASSDAG